MYIFDRFCQEKYWGSARWPQIPKLEGIYGCSLLKGGTHRAMSPSAFLILSSRDYCGPEEDTLIPFGPLPTFTVADTFRFMMSMTDTVSAKELVNVSISEPALCVCIQYAIM